MARPLIVARIRYALQRFRKAGKELRQVTHKSALEEVTHKSTNEVVGAKSWGTRRGQRLPMARPRRKRRESTGRRGSFHKWNP